MIVTINDNNVLKTFNILDSSAIADVFDSTQSYVIGDYCVYGNTLYKFVENHNAGAWSSSDVTQVFITDELASLGLDINQKYEKPSGGIPASDLASAVQTSLGKADSALQTAPVTSVNTKTGAVTLGAGDIGYDDSATYDNGTVGKGLTDLKGGLNDRITKPSSPTTGQFLKWSGSAWVASDLPVYSGGVS